MLTYHNYKQGDIKMSVSGLRGSGGAAAAAAGAGAAAADIMLSEREREKIKTVGGRIGDFEESARCIAELRERIDSDNRKSDQNGEMGVLDYEAVEYKTKKGKRFTINTHTIRYHQLDHQPGFAVAHELNTEEHLAKLAAKEHDLTTGHHEIARVAGARVMELAGVAITDRTLHYGHHGEIFEKAVRKYIKHCCVEIAMEQMDQSHLLSPIEALLGKKRVTLSLGRYSSPEECKPIIELAKRQGRDIKLVFNASDSKQLETAEWLLAQAQDDSKLNITELVCYRLWENAFASNSNVEENENFNRALGILTGFSESLEALSLGVGHEYTRRGITRAHPPERVTATENLALKGFPKLKKLRGIHIGRDSSLALSNMPKLRHVKIDRMNGCSSAWIENSPELESVTLKYALEKSTFGVTNAPNLSKFKIIERHATSKFEFEWRSKALDGVRTAKVIESDTYDDLNEDESSAPSGGAAALAQKMLDLYPREDSEGSQSWEEGSESSDGYSDSWDGGYVSEDEGAGPEGYYSDPTPERGPEDFV